MLDFSRGVGCDFDVLLGETLASVNHVKDDDIEHILFITVHGAQYALYHNQDCCESVWVESIVGDLDDIILLPLLMAECATQDDPSNDESGTWTFYKLATVKAHIDIRWYGSSNGYYSEGVDFVHLNP